MIILISDNYKKMKQAAGDYNTWRNIGRLDVIGPARQLLRGKKKGWKSERPSMQSGLRVPVPDKDLTIPKTML